MASESALELECRKFAESQGYRLLKWVSPGVRGVPDRILLGPKQFLVFIEFKAPGDRRKSERGPWKRLEEGYERGGAADYYLSILETTPLPSLEPERPNTNLDTANHPPKCNPLVGVEWRLIIRRDIEDTPALENWLRNARGKIQFVLQRVLTMKGP